MSATDATDATDTSELEIEQGDRRGDVRWTLLLVALLVAPLVVSAVYLWFSVGTDYLPNVDLAVFELGVRDTLHHGALVGPYSRFGWNHPGPFMFYVVAAFYKVLGSRSISMQIAALAVNAATIAAIGWVAFRRGRLAVVLMVLVPVGVLTRALGAEFLRNPWNPDLPLLPLLLLLLLAWSVAVGDLWMLPIAIVVASFAVQSHVGYSLEVLALLAVAVVALVVRSARTPADDRRASWLRVARVALVSAGVLVVVWLPVLYGTFVRHDGNIGRLLDFFTSGRDTAGFHQALEVLGLQWGPRPEWIVGSRGIDLFGNTLLEPRWWVVVWLVLAAVATAVAVRRRAGETLWFAGLVGVGLVAALLAVSNVSGLMFPYLVQWTWVLGAALGILVLQGLWLACPPSRRAAVLRIATPLSVIFLAVICAVETVDAVTAGPPTAHQARERTLSSEVIAHLPNRPGPVLVDLSTGADVASGLVLALDRHGIPVEVNPANPVVYGSRRDPGGGPYRAVLRILVGQDQIRAFRGRGTRVAHYTRPQTAADLRAVRHRMSEALALPPGLVRDTMVRSVRASGRGAAEDIAIFMTEPDG